MNASDNWTGIGLGDRGTPAADWDRWLAARAADPEVVVPAGCRRLIVVAPHPDDEILGVGVTASRFAAAGVDVTVLAVTDGDASHPDSPTLSPEQLATLRVEESQRACAALGLPDPVRLGVPDGRVHEYADRLTRAISDVVRSGTIDGKAVGGRAVGGGAVGGGATSDCLVVSTWRGDGHPDHEASGRAAAAACAATGARLVEYPVWTWHWASPGDARVPWDNRRRVVLSGPEFEAKRAAVAEFVTQIAPLSDQPGDESILPGWILDRLVTREETVFWDEPVSWNETGAR